jgi:hypothetical protein
MLAPGFIGGNSLTSGLGSTPPPLQRVSSGLLGISISYFFMFLKENF